MEVFIGNALTLLFKKTVEEPTTFIFWAVIGFKLVPEAAFKASWVISMPYLAATASTLVNHPIVSAFLTA